MHCGKAALQGDWKPSSGFHVPKAPAPEKHSSTTKPYAKAAVAVSKLDPAVNGTEKESLVEQYEEFEVIDNEDDFEIVEKAEGIQEDYIEV